MEEEEEFDSEESEEELAREFPPPERKIFTQAYDLSVATLVEQWDQDLLVIPPMQREYVWDKGRASRLIESLMLNIPVPPVFFSETPEARYEIIDGHQRISSIVRFVKNEFALSGLRLQAEYLRRRFHQLPQREQRFLMTRVLRAIIISAESHPQMKFEIFQRLNTGAIALNAQEVRNGLSGGPLNERLHELARTESFRHCIGSKAPRRRMVDEELVLRFIALHSNLEQYRPPLRRFLNDFMDKNRNLGEEPLDRLSAGFVRASDFVHAMYQGRAFRVTDDRGEPTERNVNRAVFDAQMVAAGWVVDPGQLDHCRREAVSAGAELFRDPTFDDAMRLATGDRRRTLTRVKLWSLMLEGVGIDIDVPAFVRNHDPKH